MSLVTAEYIWIGGKDSHNDLRSKTRTIDIIGIESFKTLNYTELNEKYLHRIPQWNFDGSSTEQASSDSDTEVILVPCAICLDPFRKEDLSLLILCDCYITNYDGTLVPHRTNTRNAAVDIFNKYKDKHCWFGLEQEYVLYNPETQRPVGWPKEGEPEAQGKYYCGNGTDKVFVRSILEKHYQCCRYSKLSISGFNVEVMPGQYEFQIGPVEGVSAADQLILARYIILRICEDEKLDVCYNPKPLMGNWNGSGLHHNMSTKEMRSTNGYDIILKAIEKLRHKHKEHMEVYGKDNDKRLTGKHETASMNNFSWGVGTRNTSIRIPNTTKFDKKGYFEDRRPAANCDPYLSTSKLLETSVSNN